MLVIVIWGVLCVQGLANDMILLGKPFWVLHAFFQDQQKNNNYFFSRGHFNYLQKQPLLYSRSCIIWTLNCEWKSTNSKIQAWIRSTANLYCRQKFIIDCHPRHYKTTHNKKSGVFATYNFLFYKTWQCLLKEMITFGMVLQVQNSFIKDSVILS